MLVLERSRCHQRNLEKANMGCFTRPDERVMAWDSEQQVTWLPSETQSSIGSRDWTYIETERVT
jgi:hypothetical protein